MNLWSGRNEESKLNRPMLSVRFALESIVMMVRSGYSVQCGKSVHEDCVEDLFIDAIEARRDSAPLY